MRKNYYLCVLFIINAVSMILELIAARILAPNFGSSNAVWTIVISLMLFANSIGNYTGGRLSDKYSPDILFALCLTISSIFIYLIASINVNAMNMPDYFSSEDGFNVALMTIILFLIPSIAIGMVSPVINKMELNEDNMGKRSGIIYAVMTAGSLFGTLFGGFFLLLRFGSNRSLYILSIVVAVCAITIICTSKVYGQYVLVILMTAVIILSCVKVFELRADNGILEVNNDRIMIDTEEGYVIIDNRVRNGENVRLMQIYGGNSSANYLDPEKRDELVFDYTKAYNVVIDEAPDKMDYLMIGGGGYSWPRYFKSHYPDKNIDVVEIDQGVTDAAKKYFYLQDFLDEYGEDSMELITADGRIYMEKTENTYDVILNDTFLGHIPARTMATAEAAMTIKKCLNKNGIYATNVIGDMNEQGINFLRSEYKTIASVFDHIWIQKATQYTGKNNYIIIASDYDYSFDTMDINISGDDIVLTDDYSPVEYLTMF